MIKRGAWPQVSLHQDLVEIVGGAVGAGAAALTASPSTGTWGLSARDNFFTVTGSSQTSTGLFVCAFKEFPATILDIQVEVHNASGTTLVGACRTYSIANQTVTIDIRDGASSAAVANPTTSDNIRIVVIGRNSAT